MGRKCSAQPLASIESDAFYDFQTVRPYVSLVGGVIQGLSWPTNEFGAARVDNASHDLILFVGMEPNLRWKTFTELIVEVASANGVSAPSLSALC
jgi:hypothetical protein